MPRSTVDAGSLRALFYGRGWVLRREHTSNLRLLKFPAVALPPELVQALTAANLTELSGTYTVDADNARGPLHVNLLGVEHQAGRAAITVYNLNRRPLVGDQRPAIRTITRACGAIERFCPPPVTPLYDIGVSYPHEEVALARSVVRDLEELSSVVLWDRGSCYNPNLSTEDEVFEYLVRPLAEGAACLFVIATEAFVASEWVAVDLSCALARLKPVFVWCPRDDRISSLGTAARGSLSSSITSKLDLLRDKRITAHSDLARSEASGVAKGAHLLLRAVRILRAKGMVADSISVQDFLERSMRTAAGGSSGPSDAVLPNIPPIAGWSVKGPRYD